jgi:hypothetical protein
MTVGKAIDHAGASLALVELVGLTADGHELRVDVEANFAEAVRTGLIHRLLPIPCPKASDRGRSGPDWASELEWS